MNVLIQPTLNTAQRNDFLEDMLKKETKCVKHFVKEICEALSEEADYNNDGTPDDNERSERGMYLAFKGNVRTCDM